ncbi:MAG: PQQ-binding-like beta-propeller repeat protein [Xanthomonadaceae bacterium]|nr:PQQ-binding-like beta-propeller repeat protein [Xanthomonadaceae bacterium]
MWGTLRGLLCLGLLASQWQSARAEPWTEAADPNPQPAGAFVPALFSEFAADGYWASGVIVQNREVARGALIRFDADGRQQARSFVGANIQLPLKRLADGGVLYAAGRTTAGDVRLTRCELGRLDVAGKTQWQIVLDGGDCRGLEMDATGAIWVALGDHSSLRIAAVLRLREDGVIAARVGFDDPLDTLVEMRADPAAAGVFVAGHRRDAGNPQVARARIQRLRADGSADWLWQSSTSATASSVAHLRVSASAGIFALSSRFVPGGSGRREKDWLAVGLSLGGVPRFETTIRFDKAATIVGSSAPVADGLWLVLQHGGNGSDGASDTTISVARLSASGNLTSSRTISGGQFCGSRATHCPLAPRRDGGLWLLVYDGANETHSIVGVDGEGRERARLPVFSQLGLLLLPDDRALGITGRGLLGPIGAQRIGFDQPAEPWSQLAVPGRPLAPIEAVASDGAVAQWISQPNAIDTVLPSTLTFRASDTAPIAWQIEFALATGKMQLSVSRSMVCLAGWGQDLVSIHYLLQCHRRSDGSLLWQDTRPPPGGSSINRFQAVAALDDGRAVAISSEFGELSHWLLGDDGEILSEQSYPLLGSTQQGLLLSQATFNAQGDALLAGFDFSYGSGSLLRLDHDGSERFRSAFTGNVTFANSQNRLAFASDGGAIMYGDESSVIARYLASGEKLWELIADQPVADLVVDGDTIVYSMRDGGVSLRNGDGEVFFNPGEWELVALDSASGDERWRFPLGASFGWSAGIALIAPQRLAALQTERNHLRYRELDIAAGTLLREQTDSCGGEICECSAYLCVPFFTQQFVVLQPPLPLQWVDGRLRARVGNLHAGAGWGSNVLELADAGRVASTVRADQDGVSGAWYAPWSSGQGLAFDWIVGSRTLFANWLTFAPDGGNDPSGLRWYTLQGELAEPSPDAALDIFINEGGRFGVGVTAPRRVGSARLRFESCDRAQFSYQFDPDESEGLSGLVTLSRLTPGVACSGSPAGTNSPAVSDAIDGAWFDPASSGQGLMFNAIPAQDTLFATWFTYDTESAADDLRQQHWFTLQGPLGTGGQSTLDIIRTTGGALFRVPTSNSQRVGTATVTRFGCDRLRLDYQFDDSEIAGPFRRISDFRELQRIGGCAD